MTAAPTVGRPPGGVVQVPRSLLYSTHHSGLAVWAWAMYETLMPRRIKGGRAPAIARRAFLAGRAGVSNTTLDDARRQLLASTSEGAFLSRSAPRGSKRSVLHVVKRRPAETGERFAAVPAWTLDLVWAGRRRPRGMVSVEAWRLYAAAVDRAGRRRGGRSGPFDTTVGHLASLLGVSASTARRRLAEVEAAGLAEVTQRRGGWLALAVTTEPDQAARAAEVFARQGRIQADCQRSPSQVAALTPRKRQDPPLPDSGTPQKAPLTYAPVEESLPLPAAGVYSNQGERVTAAGRPPYRPSRSVRPPLRHVRAAAGLYRLLPVELTAAIAEHGSRRVLTALASELQCRSPGEMARRIDRNWVHWQRRIVAGEPIRDPVAVAIRISRRGLQCPDIRCEDGHQLDLDAPCKACALAAAERHAPQAAPDAPEAATSRVPTTTSSPKAGGEPLPPRRPPEPAKAGKAAPVDGKRHAELARRLLSVRNAAEREALIASHQRQSKSA